MGRFTVRDQLRLGYLAVILILLAPLIASVIYIGRTANAFARSDEHHDLIIQAQELAIAAQRSAHNVTAYALGHLQHRAEYERNRQLFIATLASLGGGSAFLTRDQRALILELDALRMDFDAASTAVFDAADRHREIGSPDTQSDEDIALLVYDTLANQLEQTLAGLTDSLHNEVEAETGTIQQQIAVAAVLALFGSAASAGGAIIISQAASARIVPPITRLAAVAREVAQGDLTQRANVTATNEIGELAATFDQMAEQLSESIKGLEHGLVEATVAREQAERAEKIKGAFLASMSHELRTPLNAIINFTRFVAEGDMGEVNAQQKELLTEVIASGKHLLSLINDVLDMSKIEAGALNLFVEDNVSLVELLHTLATITGGLLAGKPVRVLTEFRDDLPPVRADRQRLYQSLLNVAANAAKFTEEGQITIKADVVDKTIEITISDTGAGIASQDFNAVFETFKQTEAGLRMGRGTGLGMPIARSLIEAHGGQIRLQSAVGRGTVFTISIPIKSEMLKPKALVAGKAP